jgi:hypothetical protein
LDGDYGDRTAEQAHDIQEAAGDIFGDQDGDVLVGGVALALDVPVFDGADDVAGVRGPEHDLDLEADAFFRIGQEHVEPTAGKLHLLPLDHVKLKPELHSLAVSDAVRLLSVFHGEHQRSGNPREST